MNRRATLPGAAELFGSTTAGKPAESGARQGGGDVRAAGEPQRRGSGRQRHDSKITVYVSDEELLALERARLSLRASYGLAVDRGRMVREAVVVLLADLDEHGADSVLVRRLRPEPGP
ncbi:MAG: hypothetical protein ACRDQ5_19965 [Sciscionella sp.]